MIIVVTYVYSSYFVHSVNIFLPGACRTSSFPVRDGHLLRLLLIVQLFQLAGRKHQLGSGRLIHLGGHWFQHALGDGRQSGVKTM